MAMLKLLGRLLLARRNSLKARPVRRLSQNQTPAIAAEHVDLFHGAVVRSRKNSLPLPIGTIAGGEFFTSVQ